MNDLQPPPRLNDRLAESSFGTVEQKWKHFKSIVYKIS